MQNKSTPTRLGNYSVVRSAIEPRAVGNDQIAANAITNDQVQADAIRQAQLDSDSVGRNEIINGEVVESKLATDAVTRDKVLNGEIVDGKLGDASVNLINMKPNSVANTQLTTDSVNFRTVATNAIGNENMLGDSVGNDELQNDSVGGGELRNDSVGFGELQSSSVGNSTLQTGSVTRSKIGSGQVGSAQIANGAVTSSRIGSGQVGTTQIANLAVTSNKIGNNEVTSTKISAATRRIIVSGGLATGSGITKYGNLIAVNFGGGSTQVARGNHTHRYSYGFYTRDLAGRRLTGFVTSSRSTNAPSTRRVKKNIETHTPSNIKNLLDLEPKKYKYKRSERASHESLNKEWMHGYIAEELIDLGFPEPVGYDAEGRPASLDYGLMSMLVLELVKVQQDEINLLREEVLILKDKK